MWVVDGVTSTLPSLDGVTVSRFLDFGISTTTRGFGSAFFKHFRVSASLEAEQALSTDEAKCVAATIGFGANKNSTRRLSAQLSSLSPATSGKSRSSFELSEMRWLSGARNRKLRELQAVAFRHVGERGIELLVADAYAGALGALHLDLLHHEALDQTFRLRNAPERRDSGNGQLRTIIEGKIGCLASAVAMSLLERPAASSCSATGARSR